MWLVQGKTRLGFEPRSRDLFLSSFWVLPAYKWTQAPEFWGTAVYGNPHICPYQWGPLPFLELVSWDAPLTWGTDGTQWCSRESSRVPSPINKRARNSSLGPAREEGQDVLFPSTLARVTVHFAFPVCGWREGRAHAA
jgi:hypothetical protein